MAKRVTKGIPSYENLLIPTLKALVELGGSGSIDEIDQTVYSIANISDEMIAIPHKEGDERSAIRYNLAWSRTYLKKYGLIENTSRRVWSLTNGDISPNSYTKRQIVDFVRGLHHKNDNNNSDNTVCNDSEAVDLTLKEVEATEQWKEQLLKTLYSITPDAFERLTQRILKVSGFSQVEVTGKSGDGGIDGKGIINISGLISFHVIFQCKRYKGSVTSSQVRDFRGAMQGRADKGILITTGVFTRDAIKEATRDGAPPIDLIDGESLCYKLKELNLGVETKLVEEVLVDREWFGKL